MPWLLNLAYGLLFALFLPKVAWMAWRRGKYRESFPRALCVGLSKRHRAADFAGGSIWIHGASVGEIVAAKALLPEIEARRGGLKLVVSTVTETGQAQARRLFPQADAIIYFPYDFSWNAARFQRFFNPKAFALLEAEIWPNFLMKLRKRGCPVFLFNGKVSDRSFRGWRRAAKFLGRALDAISLVNAQTEADAERFRALLGRPGDVVVAGNVKLDSLPAPLSPERRVELAAQCGLAGDAPILLFASTHPTEEELCLDACLALRRDYANLRAILCPRHPERFAGVWKLCGERLSGSGVRTARLSDPATLSGGDVDFLLLDQMGKLAEFFGLATVAVMGGSFAPIGGHNILEAAPHGVPIVCGPHMRAQRELVRLATEGGVFLQVDDADALAPKLAELLGDDAERERIAAGSRALVEAHRGAAKRAFAEIDRRGLWPVTRG